MLRIFAVFAAVHSAFAWLGTVKSGVEALNAEIARSVAVAVAIGSFLFHGALVAAPIVGHGLAFAGGLIGTVLVFVGSLLTRLNASK